jgi:hypothetical protein
MRQMQQNHLKPTVLSVASTNAMYVAFCQNIQHTNTLDGNGKKTMSAVGDISYISDSVMNHACALIQLISYQHCTRRVALAAEPPVQAIHSAMSDEFETPFAHAKHEQKERLAHTG